MNDAATPEEKLREIWAFSRILVSYMNHELRGSVNIVGGYTGLALEEEAEPLDDQKRTLEVAADASMTLLRQVEDLVEACRIEFGLVVPEPARFDLSDVAREAAAEYEHPAALKDLALRIEGGALPVFTDRRMVRACIDELLDNAVKYTARGNVRLLWKHAGTEVEITVADTGVGMAEEERTKLLRTYVRLPYAVRNRIPGTGLGLYLVGMRVALLGGMVSVSSIPGEGTTVTLRFPAMEAI
jgi:signal transduction histidine kinase